MGGWRFRMLSMAQLVIWFSQTALMLGAAPFLMPRVSLSEFLPDLEDLSNRIGKLEEEGTPDPEKIYALAKVIYSLSMEMRPFFSAEQIIILNENSSVAGGMTPLVILAAALGALGCGFMWQKGIFFYEFMYVTKQNMAHAVASMTKHLDQVSAALAAAKKHLTQRIENLDGKMDEQKEISGEIKNENGRVSSIKGKQFVGGKGGKMPDFLTDDPDSSGKRRFLGASEARQLKGLQHIVEAFETENYGTSNID